MGRKLLLTPYEYYYLEAYNHIINDGIKDPVDMVDMPYILLSALTMSGVDDINYIAPLSKWQTNLISETKSKSGLKKWAEIYDKADLAFERFNKFSNDKEVERDISNFKHKIISLLFSLRTNSGLLIFEDFKKINNSNNLPLEITIPFGIFTTSLQAKIANLPVIKYDIEKKDLRRYMDILQSKEYTHYKESQTEIEVNQNLTDKTIKAIELAGKNLYKKNRSVLNLEENLIRAIPLSSKLVDLFFGKLPSVLAEYSSAPLIDYLKTNKSIPIYDCENLLKGLNNATFNKRYKDILSSEH